MVVAVEHGVRPTMGPHGRGPNKPHRGGEGPGGRGGDRWGNPRMTIRRTLDRSLWEPYCHLPSQTATGPAPSPERALACAVLETALHSLELHLRHPHPPGSANRAVIEHELSWLFDEESTAPFAAVNIAHWLGIDLAHLQAHVVAWIQQVPRGALLNRKTYVRDRVGDPRSKMRVRGHDRRRARTKWRGLT